MSQTILTAFPTRIVFVRNLLRAVFPDSDGKSYYAQDCADASEALTQNNDLGVLFRKDDRFAALTYASNEYVRRVMGDSHTNLTISEKNGCCFQVSINNLTQSDSGTIKEWLKTKNSKSRINNGLDYALFFTYLLLTSEKCAKTRKPFLLYCLQILDVNDVPETLQLQLDSVDWHTDGHVEAGDRSFGCLTCMTVRLAALLIPTVFCLLGRVEEKYVQAFRVELDNLLRQERLVQKGFEAAQDALCRSNIYFDPRSSETTESTLFPQDFFVIPRFMNANGKEVSPVASIRKGAPGSRVLIMGKTGLGKSLFMQMLTLGCLVEKYKPEHLQKTEPFTNLLQSPTDMAVLSVSARLFSVCYSDPRYKDWTQDLVTLFFQGMWQLSAGYNFYSTQTSQRLFDNQATLPKSYQMTEELRNYVKTLAHQGRLLLLLDSFDEISSGNMREDYFSAVRRFYDEFIGAHIIVCTREMSENTMRSLKNALQMHDQNNSFYLCELNRDQRNSLICKWSNYKKISPDTLIKQIDENHFYDHYAANPYMLSVVCFNWDKEISQIPKDIIQYLLDRMVSIRIAFDESEKNADMRMIMANLLQMVQNNVLYNLAVKMIMEGLHVIDRRYLMDFLKENLKFHNLEPDEVNFYCERIHEILVTESGLLVFADGNDDCYQFINPQILYEMAAKGFYESLMSGTEVDKGQGVLSEKDTTVEDYVGVMVPLICACHDSLPLSEQLISILSLRSYGTQNENELLTRAMMDLVLYRYGANLSTSRTIGEKKRPILWRSQRLLMMRILTSDAFHPTRSEWEKLMSSQAFRMVESFISDEVIRLAEKRVVRPIPAE